MTSLNHLAKSLATAAREKGWGFDPTDVNTMGTKLTLVISEVVEAFEEIRKGHAPTDIYFVPDDNGQKKPEGVPIELADALIRILHICGEASINIDQALRIKMEYNETRSWRHGGKIA